MPGAHFVGDDTPDPLWDAFAAWWASSNATSFTPEVAAWTAWAAATAAERERCRAAAALVGADLRTAYDAPGHPLQCSGYAEGGADAADIIEQRISDPGSTVRVHAAGAADAR